MIDFWADLHIHTLLSPCGDLEMSPRNIVRQASLKGLDIIGITDHNTTRHCRLITEMGNEAGIFVLPGAEVNTQEEVHCLTFFDSLETLDVFQSFLDEFLPLIENDPDEFGDQVQVDRDEMIIYEEKRSLFSAIDKSIDEVESKVHELGGLFIPAHIDRPRNSLFSQLGFLPEDLKADALEISRNTNPSDICLQYPELKAYTFIKSSDAHFIEDIGRQKVKLSMKSRSFDEIKKALGNREGRRVVIR